MYFLRASWIYYLFNRSYCLMQWRTLLKLCRNWLITPKLQVGCHQIIKLPKTWIVLQRFISFFAVITLSCWKTICFFLDHPYCSLFCHPLQGFIKFNKHTNQLILTPQFLNLYCVYLKLPSIFICWLFRVSLPLPSCFYFSFIYTYYSMFSYL